MAARIAAIAAFLIVFLAAGADAQAAQGGSDCGDPLRVKLPRQKALELTSGDPMEFSARRLPDGTSLDVSTERGEFERIVWASTSSRRWRVCALISRHPRSKILAPVSREDGESIAQRRFFEGTSSLTLSYARRDGAEDGASCANPYVVETHSGEPNGDLRAGSARVEQYGGLGEQRYRVGLWESAAGYRTCFAAGLGAPAYDAEPFVDRRRESSLSHVLDTYSCCPNHGPTTSYFFAAFRRD